MLEKKIDELIDRVLIMLHDCGRDGPNNIVVIPKEMQERHSEVYYKLY